MAVMSRERLPDERFSVTRGFEIPYLDESKKPHRLKFYAVAGLYEDGRIAELFLYVDRKDDYLVDLLSGVLDTVGTITSIALQHGVPIDAIAQKLRYHQFGPSGFIGDRQFTSCTSMFDLLAQWLQATFPNGKLARK